MSSSERPLVEGYGLAEGERPLLAIYRSRAVAEDQLDMAGKRTVVPLIAADRLTGSVLHDDVCRYLVQAGVDGDFTVQDVLAALRAHLEGL